MGGIRVVLVEPGRAVIAAAKYRAYLIKTVTAQRAESAERRREGRQADGMASVRSPPCDGGLALVSKRQARRRRARARANNAEGDRSTEGGG